MRYLPCRVCGQPALASRDGILHCAGSLSSPSYSYLCRRCGRLQTITASVFNQLPLMTAEEIAAESCDLPVSALTETKPEPEPEPEPKPEPEPPTLT